MATNQRLVDGPDRDYLTRGEVAAYLRMSSKTLGRLMARGRFPRPFKMGQGTMVWSWREIWAYAILREIRHRYQKDPDSVGGQTGTKRDKHDPIRDKRSTG